jgi:NADH-quinone oxidoreductase subunit M
VILAATYILKMYQHVFMGEVKEAPHADENTYKLHWTELAVLIPILIAIFWIGIQPGGFFDNMAASTNNVVANIEQAETTYAEQQRAIAEGLGNLPADGSETEATPEATAEAGE